MDKIYCKVLAWSIMRLVNRQKNYHDRCDRLNRIVNWLVDVYSDYSKMSKTKKDFGPDCEGNCYPCTGCVYDDYSKGGQKTC